MTLTRPASEGPGAFSPTVRVLSPAPADPASPDMSFEAILAKFPALADAEAVCWTGSTAAGWGNPQSDVDLFAFSDTDLDLPPDETSETWMSTDKSGVGWFNWMGRYQDVLVDLEVWRTDSLSKVLEPYLAANEAEFCNLTHDMQDFIYRMSVARPLKNADFFEEAREPIQRSSYPRSLARSLKALAENRMIDAVGQLEGGDAMSARFTATNEVAFVTADICLLLAGDLCRRPKWLMRRLAATPQCGISVEEYRSVVLNGPDAAESDGEYALRVCRWAQSHLIRVERETLAMS